MSVLVIWLLRACVAALHCSTPHHTHIQARRPSSVTHDAWPAVAAEDCLMDKVPWLQSRVSSDWPDNGQSTSRHCAGPPEQVTSNDCGHADTSCDVHEGPRDDHQLQLYSSSSRPSHGGGGVQQDIEMPETHVCRDAASHGHDDVQPEFPSAQPEIHDVRHVWDMLTGLGNVECNADGVKRSVDPWIEGKVH